MRRQRGRENGMAHEILLPVKSRTAVTSSLGRENTHFGVVSRTAT